MKIVIIGAGSMQFSPSLFNSITQDPVLQNCELGLVDVNAESLEIAERLACRLVKERGLKMQVKASTNRRDILPGTDAVTATIAVGGMEASTIDVKIPAKYGCIQPVGDTSGPGGFSRILRHTPEMVAIAEDMADLCPNATLYNYTNPLTALTRAVTKYTPIEAIGLCIGPELTWGHVTDFIGVDKNDTYAMIAGLNHCHWVLGLRRGEEDLLPWIAARLAQIKGDNSKMAAIAAQTNAANAPSIDPFQGHVQTFCLALYEALGYYPGPGDWHICEYFPQYLHAPGANDVFKIKDGSVIEIQEKEHPIFFEKMRKQAFGEEPLSEEMFGQHSYGEESQLTAILTARRQNKPFPLFANVPNNGCIENLPDETIVEVPCVINSNGIMPLHVGNLPSQIAAPLNRMVHTIEVIIEAAMKGSRELAFQGYANDPYCTNLETGAKLVNELIDATISWLPRFRSQ